MSDQAAALCRHGMTLVLESCFECPEVRQALRRVHPRCQGRRGLAGSEQRGSTADRGTHRQGYVSARVVHTKQECRFVLSVKNHLEAAAILPWQRVQATKHCKLHWHHEDDEEACNTINSVSAPSQSSNSNKVKTTALGLEAGSLRRTCCCHADPLSKGVICRTAACIRLDGYVLGVHRSIGC